MRTDPHRPQQAPSAPAWQNRILFAAIFLAGALSYWLISTPWPDTPDGLFHLQRVRSLAEAMVGGVLYPRWFADFSFGYGYPVLNFYGPLFYYPAAMLHLLGFDLITATQATLAAWAGLSGAFLFYFLRRWTGPGPALAGTAVYTFFPYRIYDVVVRGALPEFAAFLWLPLIAYAGQRLTQSALQTGSAGSPGAQQPRIGHRSIAVLVLLALAWAGLIITHNLTAFMAVLVFVVTAPLAVLCYGRSRPGGRIWHAGGLLLAGLVLGATLTAWYSLPVLLEARWVAIGSSAPNNGYANHLAAWQELVTWVPVYPYPAADQPSVPLPAYALVILGAAALLAAAGYPPSSRKQLALILLPTVIVLWLTTESSRFLWQMAGPLLAILQFPWRWQAPATLGIVLLTATLLAALEQTLRNRYGPRQMTRLAVTALPAVTALYVTAYALLDLPRQAAPYSAEELSTEQMWAFDAAHGQVGASWTGEFLPRWVTEQRWAIGRDPSEPEQEPPKTEQKMTAQPETVGYLHRTWSVDSPSGGDLVFADFYYPAWRILVDGRPAETYALGSLGLLAARITPGSHQVELTWRTTPAVWLGRLIAAASCLLIAFALWRSGRRWMGLVFAGLVPGVLVLGLLAGRLGATAEPRPIGADYATIRLEGVSIPAATAGGTAKVRLFWLVTGQSEPLTSFVHIVDAEGRIVAQQDGPLAGEYVPASRWWPGELLSHTHAVKLPEAMAPGRYAVKVGVYPSGQPENPLAPEGSGDARVDAGWLEVSP